MKESGFCRCFQAIELCLLHIIFASDYSESSHSTMLRSRLYRGSLPTFDRSPKRSSVLRALSPGWSGIVVGGVEADVPEPASDQLDVNAGRDLLAELR